MERGDCGKIIDTESVLSILYLGLHKVINNY